MYKSFFFFKCFDFFFFFSYILRNVASFFSDPIKKMLYQVIKSTCYLINFS